MKWLLLSSEILVSWLHEKLNGKQFIVFASILVGITVGLAVVLLKTIVHYIHIFITYQYFPGFHYPIFIVLPLIGILLTIYYVQKYLKGNLNAGVSKIIVALLKKSGFLPRHQMYSHIITSGLTVGFGGSCGLEAPIVATGAAIGSNFAKSYRLEYKERVLLLACGAAAGIAATFNSPIAGVLFTLEVLLMDITISAFIPLILAAAVGTICSNIILKEEILLSFQLQQAFNYENIPFYIVLGLLAGCVSVYYMRMFTRVGNLFKSTSTIYKKAMIGGGILAVLLLLFPSLFGEGFDSIKVLASMHPEQLLERSIFSGFMENKWVVLVFVFSVMLVKVVATSITINSGGNGGNFAPSLFVGAYLGFFFSYLINLSGIAKVSASNFTIVGMVGILSGIFHAPLTAIFLIAEITGGYELMIPLMIVSALSYSIVKYFEPHSMDFKKVVKEGYVLTNDKDQMILSSLKVAAIIETDFHKVDSDASLGVLVDVISKSKRNIFPVVDKNNRLVGIILMDNVREIIFKTELYESRFVKELMIPAPAEISFDEPMHSIMKKFDETGAWHLPVVKGNGIYAGFISKSSIFANYRDLVQKRSID